MLNCGACGKFLSLTGAATCSICPAKYHRACLALGSKAQLNKDWVCPSCKKNPRKGDETPIKGICGDTEAGLMELDAGGRSPVAHQAAMEARTDVCEKSDALGLKEFRREFLLGMAEMREFRKEMALLRDSFTAVTLRLDAVEQRLEVLERRQSEVGPESTLELERTISQLKQELNDRDQEALLADLEIGHLPEEKGESVMHAVTSLAGRMGLSLDERDVVFAERVGAPPSEAGGRPRRVVVRLARRHLRDELLRAARVRRTLTTPNEVRVFLNERLTRQNRQLFHRVREECRRLQWHYSWTKRGRIFARQGEGRPIFQFRAEEDFARAFGHPVSVSK